MFRSEVRIPMYGSCGSLRPTDYKKNGEKPQYAPQDMAANRYYYACFHAVQGLFIHKGIFAHKHAGVVSQFSLHFVKTGLVERNYGSFLARMMQLRQKADYNCAYDITEKDVSEIISLSRDFVRKVEFLIQRGA